MLVEDTLVLSCGTASAADAYVARYVGDKFVVKYDGSATFAADVQIGAFDATMILQTAYIYANGQFRVNRTDGNARVFSALLSNIDIALTAAPRLLAMAPLMEK